MPDLSDKVSDYRLQQIRTMTGGEELPHYEAAAMARELLAYRTRPPASSMEGWQTMDSAPKDGTSVLVWMLDAHSTEPSKYAVAWWGNHTWTRGGDDYDLVIEPTHWQPLPIPPEVMK